jgi:uncharacterized cupredoxin-like copper-binding protein
MGRSSAGRFGVCRAAVYPVAAALLVVIGCSSGRAPARVARNVVAVTEGDFHISVAQTHATSGDVVLSVHNRGPDDHELIVVRARDSALPLRADGVTIDEDALEPAKVGILEPGEPGSVRELRLRLAPGRYELFCNMAGHYLGGMYAELMVS